MTTTAEASSSEKQHQDDDSSFPALKHRPVPIPTPAQPRTLAPVRNALLKNPDVNLTEHAAGVVTAGLVDPPRFKMLTEVRQLPDGSSTSLLNHKRVTEGVAFTTPQHDRYIDMSVLPDVAGARWAHTLHNQLDVDATDVSPAQLATATGPDGPLAMLELRVADHAELARRIREAFVKTNPDQSTAGNDYTDSVLQSGVKEPLLLMPLRVVFDDDSDDEHYLTTIDGNSRLVSMWKGRTGGNIDQAASECIAAVVGAPAGKTWRAATQRHIRDRLAAQATLINKGLSEDELAEATIRAGHTVTAPTVVVVGGRVTGDSAALTDLVAAREDLIATIHTDATPWAVEAQAEQGMARLLRRAVKEGLMTHDQRRVIEGECTPEEMHDLLDIPPHRLWAAALTLQVVLNPWYDGMKRIFREEFNVKGNPTRLVIGQRLAPTALSGYRSAATIRLASNAFGDGGPIASWVWDYKWPLKTGGSAVAVLDDLLEEALLKGTTSKSARIRRNAKAQLCVLGGTAAILDGLITRDRGSKVTEDGKRTVNKVPYRNKPYRLVEELAKSEGGLRTLHSLAVAHITGKSARQFHTESDDAGTYSDGDPLLDGAGVQMLLEMEWDLAVAADPSRAADGIAAAGASGSGGTDKPEAQKLREQLKQGTDMAVKAVAKLTTLKASQGVDVFGSYESIQTIMAHLQEARDDLSKNGPSKPIILDDDDEDDEDDA